MLESKLMNESLLRERRFPGERLFQISQGDITLEDVDAIVNAANSSLQHGGGVAAAISRRGGRIIQEESNAWIAKHGRVSHGEPAYTNGGKLACRYVIHAVGPIAGEGDEAAKLESAITGSLALADRLELRSIAFPAISTGIYGFPKDQAAEIFLRVIPQYFMAHPHSELRLIRITLYDQPTLTAFLQIWDRTQP
jgi:O-acetyl-ADP-ribose deacetylase